MAEATKQNNIGYYCTAWQCEQGLADKTAMRWIDAKLQRTDYSFADLERETNRFANALTGLGLGKGDVLFTFLPKLPEQFFSFLGALKCQVLTGTLFSNFGDEALLDRLGDAKARVLVTKRSLLRKVKRIREQLPALEYVIVVDLEEHEDAMFLSYGQLVRAAEECFEVAPTSLDTPSVIHYTSGSTGKPKGVVHVHRSLAHQQRTTAEVLGLQADDIFWCTADQGWVTGTSYGIIGPWSLGVTQVHFGGVYSARHWAELLKREQVSVWYTAPTALRMLMREDQSLWQDLDAPKLRAIYSVGEPLNPEVIHWARRVMHKEIYDTWFQTETGGIMIANVPGREIRPGSMGVPMAGIEAAILDEEGHPVEKRASGNLCVRQGWPSMFITYLNRDADYQVKFRNGFYFTGDTATVDADGYIWFQGRSDDVINTGGHLISPFEVESALLEIDEVAESGVIGAPDELLYEKVVAFIHLHDHVEHTPELELKIRLHLANRVSSLATPQEMLFVDKVPKNKSGKIMRRVLKARYLGQDEGDLSTLDEG